MAAPRDRYHAEGVEAEFEPGSHGSVLRNLRGIHSMRAMAQAESEALLVATNRVIDQTDVDQRFTAADICGMHRLWLGGIYAWAGEYRQVNMMKDGFPFAAADAQALALGTVHAELIFIHPFREGNGRCARLLASLMGVQAGLPMLDFSGIRGEAKRRYIAAIHAAVGRDYRPIAAVFRAVIDRTLRLQASALRG